MVRNTKVTIVLAVSKGITVHLASVNFPFSLGTGNVLRYYIMYFVYEYCAAVAVRIRPNVITGYCRDVQSLVNVSL